MLTLADRIAYQNDIEYIFICNNITVLNLCKPIGFDDSVLESIYDYIDISMLNNSIIEFFDSLTL